MIDKKVALIIGAGNYLGSSLAKRFAIEGFHSVVTRRRGDINNLVEEIKKMEETPLAFIVMQEMRIKLKS